MSLSGEVSLLTLLGVHLPSPMLSRASSPASWMGIEKEWKLQAEHILFS